MYWFVMSSGCCRTSCTDTYASWGDSRLEEADWEQSHDWSEPISEKEIWHQSENLPDTEGSVRWVCFLWCSRPSDLRTAAGVSLDYVSYNGYKSITWIFSKKLITVKTSIKFVGPCKIIHLYFFSYDFKHFGPQS